MVDGDSISGHRVKEECKTVYSLMTILMHVVHIHFMSMFFRKTLVNSFHTRDIPVGIKAHTSTSALAW